MANALPPNLLEEAIDGKGRGGGKMILVEDSVETTGAFLLHHLLKRALPPNSSDLVLFLSFAYPFSHYDRVLRKMGCNLSVQRDNKRFLFFDMLKLENLDRDRGKTIDDILVSLYLEVQKAVEVCLSHDTKRCITLVIDDVSLMEVDAKGSSKLVLDFLHYCYSLTSQFVTKQVTTTYVIILCVRPSHHETKCNLGIVAFNTLRKDSSLITLSHEDVYSSTDKPNVLLQLEYLADVVIKVEPLATGLANDVHGQLTVTNKGLQDGSSKSRNRIHNFHFRIKDSSVEYFYPGSKT